MSIRLFNIHEHGTEFSLITNLRKNYNFKYEMSGWYQLKENGIFTLNKKDYIQLHCNTCGYRYRSLKYIQTYTTNDAHDVFFREFGEIILYRKNNKAIQVNNSNYYLSDYYLINNEYGDIIYIGTEKEIRDYLYSKMKRYEELYELEKSKNNSLYKANERKKEKVMELNRENDDFKKMKDELQIENAKLKEENTLLQNAVTNYSKMEIKENHFY